MVSEEDKDRLRWLVRWVSHICVLAFCGTIVLLVVGTVVWGVCSVSDEWKENFAESWKVSAMFKDHNEMESGCIRMYYEHPKHVNMTDAQLVVGAANMCAKQEGSVQSLPWGIQGLALWGLQWREIIVNGVVKGVLSASWTTFNNTIFSTDSLKTVCVLALFTTIVGLGLLAMYALREAITSACSTIEEMTGGKKAKRVAAAAAAPMAPAPAAPAAPAASPRVQRSV